MPYQFEVDNPVPDDFPEKGDVYQELTWRKNNAPFGYMGILDVARLLNRIGWDTEAGKILNATGTLNRAQIIWLMDQQPAYAELFNQDAKHVFEFALQHDYGVKVLKPGDKAEMYREMAASQDEA